MKQLPQPHNYLTQYVPHSEKKNLIRYYNALAEFKIKEIEEIHKVIYALEKTLM